MTVQWDDDVADVITGDAAAGCAHVTSSLHLPEKIARMRENPSVAIVYHVRGHGFCKRPASVLVQGAAAVPTHPDQPWLQSITPRLIEA